MNDGPNKEAPPVGDEPGDAASAGTGNNHTPLSHLGGRVKLRKADLPAAWSAQAKRGVCR